MNASTFQVGDRVLRVSHVNGQPMYEAKIGAVVPTNRGYSLYQLERDDGSLSPIKVRASVLKPLGDE